MKTTNIVKRAALYHGIENLSTKTLLDRLSLILNVDLTAYLIDGVPVSFEVIDEEKFIEWIKNLLQSQNSIEVIDYSIGRNSQIHGWGYDFPVVVRYHSGDDPEVYTRTLAVSVYSDLFEDDVLKYVTV